MAGIQIVVAMRQVICCCVLLGLYAGVGGCATVNASRSLEQYLNNDFVSSLNAANVALGYDPAHSDAQALAGWSNFQLGKYREAQHYFREILEADEKDFDALLGMGWAEYKLGRTDLAERYFTLAGQNSSSLLEKRFVLDAFGWLEITRGNLEVARKRFIEEANRTDSDLLVAIDAQVGLGWIALLKRKYSEAKKIFLWGSQRMPDCFNCYDGLARVAYEMADYEEALSLVLRGVNRVRHSGHLVWLLRATLDKIGDDRRAIEVYEGLTRKYPNAAFYHADLARAYEAQNDLAKAESSVVRALTLDPSLPGLYSSLRRIRKARTGNGTIGLFPSSRKDDPVDRDRKGIKPDVATDWLKSGSVVGRFEVLRSLWVLASDKGRTVRRPDQYLNVISGKTNRRSIAISIRLNDHSPREHPSEIRPVKAVLESNAAVPSALERTSITIYNEGWTLIDAGRLEEAEHAFRMAAATAPEGLRYLMLDALGWVSFYRRDYTEAEQIFNRVLADFPGSYLSTKGLGFVALEKGKFETARNLIIESLRKNPHQIPFSYTFPVERFISAGRYEDALHILSIAEWAHPNVASILFLSARALAAIGRNDLAKEKAEIAASLDPVRVDSRFDELGIAPREMPRAVRTLAWGLFLAGEYESALKRFGQILAAAPSDMDAIRGRGFAFFKLGRYKEAINDLSAAARHEPNELPSLSHELAIPGTGKRAQVTYNAGSTMAWAYLKSGDAAHAEFEFRRVLKDHPSWVDALSGMGYSLLAQGDPVGAARNFRNALSISPTYPDARQGLDAANSMIAKKNPRSMPRTSE